MATLADLVADVYTITNRPDLVSETKLAIRVATLKAHQSDYYPKDIYETAISFPTAAFTQQLDYRVLIPRWRSLKYLRKYDALGAAPGSFLELITPEQVLDSYDVVKDNVVYLAGEVFQVRSSAQDQHYLLGCYRNPDITDAGFSSWVALDHPYAIVFEAARVVFKQIGLDEQASEMARLVQEQYQILKQEVTAGGY